MRYFDSGVLLKLYLSEPNSAQAVALVQEQGGLPPITALHRLEMKGAIGQKYGRGEITGDGTRRGRWQILRTTSRRVSLPR